MHTAELISIGNELLAGHTINTNAAWLAQKLARIGARVCWVTTIADTPNEIISALTIAAHRADIIISTGGLGPTPDDLTKQTIAEYFNCKMILNKDILIQVKELFARRKIPMPKVNRSQAMVPETAELIKNPVGTAPALIFHQNQKLYAFLPGVPREMKALTDPFLINKIKEIYTLPLIKSALLRTTGIAESKLYETIQPIIEKYPLIEISFLPKYVGVDLRLKTDHMYDQFNAMQAEIRSELKSYIYTDAEENLEVVLGRLLATKQLTLAIAESFTGGMISDKITDVPGSSQYFMGSVIAYSNQSKMELLGVSAATIKMHGAVSEQTAREMVLGVKNRFQTNCAIATTGIAGPGGGSAEKPVGLCYIAVNHNTDVLVKQFNFGQDRWINKQRGLAAALNMLRQLLVAE
jgi:nicotinamide-nucleotide amidase